jgi:hypothetical protein
LRKGEKASREAEVVDSGKKKNFPEVSCSEIESEKESL